VRPAIFNLKSAIFNSLFLALGLAACSDSSGPTKPEPGIHFITVNTAIDLTPDGKAAVLEDLGSPNGDLYFYDTETDLLTLETTVGDPLQDVALGVSAGGRVVALHGNPTQAGLWTKAGDWVDIGSPYTTGCPPDVSGGFDVSADGTVAVGLVWNNCVAEAFRWSDASGTGTFTPLEVLGTPIQGTPGPPDNRATVISDDGTIAAGFAEKDPVDRWPAVWHADGTGFLLDPGVIFTPDSPGEVLSISADGKVLAGIWNLSGFFWTLGTGVVNIGRLPTALPSDPTFPNAIAAQGRLIFGACGDPFSGLPVAFVWTAADGMRSLQDLIAAEVTIPQGYFLTNVLATSTDGSVVLGQALDPLGATVSFVLRLPVAVYGL
jgi:uncharacterized membrane protein